MGVVDGDSDVKVVLDDKARQLRRCRQFGRGGAGVPFSEEEAKKILTEHEIGVVITLGDGEGSATAWGCDLTYDYVKINGDYRT